MEKNKAGKGDKECGRWGGDEAAMLIMVARMALLRT